MSINEKFINHCHTDIVIFTFDCHVLINDEKDFFILSALSEFILFNYDVLSE